MPDSELLSEFQRNRDRLRQLARRLLGDREEAEEAVQDAWLKVGDLPLDGIRDADAWFTTVTTRICLDRLRSRRRRAGPVIELDDPQADHREVERTLVDPGPEQEVLLADSIGVALLVVLERLSPLERVAFILHDVFTMPFDEIAGLIGRTPEAARQLASRARRRVRAEPERSSSRIAEHRRLAEAFMDAAKSGDMAGLLQLLHPDATLVPDEQAARMGAGGTIEGAAEVAKFFAGRRGDPHLALVNGEVGLVVAPGGRLLLVLLPRFEDGRLRTVRVVADPGELARLDLALLP